MVPVAATVAAAVSEPTCPARPEHRCGAAEAGRPGDPRSSLGQARDAEWQRNPAKAFGNVL